MQIRDVEANSAIALQPVETADPVDSRRPENRKFKSFVSI